MVYYLAKKGNEIMTFSGKWMELEIIMLMIPSSKSQISQVFALM
jgi:hypothetical protein